MTATASTEEPSDHPVIRPRPLPPSMAIIGSALFGLFMAIVMATVIVVLGSDGSQPPTRESLPLPGGIEVVDWMSTCTEQACDGIGALLRGTSGEGGVAGRLASAWRAAGWGSVPCVDSGTMCFSSGELRLSLNVWADVDQLDIPKLVETVRSRGLDPSRLVYVHYYRCGSIHPCQ